MMETIEIPKIAAKAVTPEGFFDVFDSFVQDGMHAEPAYEKTESIVIDAFGFRRYSNYISFKRAQNYRKNRLYTKSK